VNAVVNCTVISNFVATAHLDLLRDTVGPLHLPTEVYDEILAGKLAGYEFYDDIELNIAPFNPDGWLHLTAMTEDELNLLASLPAQLHRGESACLCIARHRSWAMLTDDRAARRQAQTWDIPVSGSIGVLLLAVSDRKLTVDEGNRVLEEMISQAHYRSPTLDLRTLLE
jgi:predicted nucleic acid-binding protein